MAYVQNQQDEENKQNPNGVAPSGNGSGVNLAPSAGVGAVGTGAGTSSNGQQAGGGSFATINQYLNANQDKAAPLANNITSGIQNQYNTLQGQNQQVTGDIKNQVSSAYTPQDQSLLAQEAANPVSFAGNAGNVSAFQKQLNDQYTGPQSAETTDAFTKQQAALNSAISQGQAATQTEAGRQGLLQGTERNKNAGVTALNSAILSQDPNSQSAIEQSYKPFSNLVSGLNQSGQDINSQIANAKQSATGASSTANSQLQNQFNGFQSGVTGNLTNAQNAVNKYNTDLSGYQVARQADQPFIGAVEGSNLLGTFGITNPFNDTVYSPMSAPTANSVSSQNDLNMQGALNQLSGQNNQLIDPNAPVGGYTAPPTVPDVPTDAMFRNVLKQIYTGSPTGDISQGMLNPSSPQWQSMSPQQQQQVDNEYNSLFNQMNQLYGNKYVTPQSGLHGQPTGLYNLVP